MVEVKDELIRFLLPGAKARGAVIRGQHIIEKATHIHGLEGKPMDIFGQVLLASIILLSVSKGGVRQVLQLDATDEQAPIKRMQAECRNGQVRGYVQWQAEAVQVDSGQGVAAWLGKEMLLSTVRDLGFGQPYVSTIQHDSDWLSEHIMHYLAQSVQVEADVVLHGDVALMIEAMPGCDDSDWFLAVEAMAKISNQTLEEHSIDSILKEFDDLGCQIVGRDTYIYACSCSDESMRKVLDAMAKEDLLDLADDTGKVTLSCQYCKRVSQVNAT
ncbi:MAG: Hsp33 family molecular chaperone HslO [Ghiorsea sp.]|nr:Hsp33 family molecular chaperone HslO [Ghiorsea sp.]